MRNIGLLKKKSCTGCGVCADVCPRRAIVMKKDREGFQAPSVDRKRCVECGLCEAACPQLTKDESFDAVKKAFAVICRDEIRENCSSGGVFGAIGKWAIEKGGAVFGAAFSDDRKKVLHKKAVTQEELLELCKSKYLQSDTSGIYAEVKKTLGETEAPVIFCGCPCQVNALKRYIGKGYENLYLIDIFCLGVVSPGAYEKYFNEVSGNIGTGIAGVDFRSRKIGWACSNVVFTADDGTEIIDPERKYFNAFQWGYSKRKVCFECQYARPERVGDLSIGDFWGIEKLDPRMNDKKGTSLVLYSTEKGKRLLKCVKHDIARVREYDYNKVLKKTGGINWAIVKPGLMPENRGVFFYRLSKGDSFSQAFRYASTDKFDVGIYGWWFEDGWTNFGSTLTYYALMEYVSSLGLSVCMIRSPYQKTAELSDFIRSHGYRVSMAYSANEMKKHNEKIGTFLLGSDQLWFYHCYKNWGHTLFLDFADKNKRKITYATSFGHKDPGIPDSEMPKLGKLLKAMTAVSVRETDGIDVLRRKFDVDAVQCLDPVFLCEMKIWDSIAGEAKRKTKGDFIFTYMLDPTPEKIKALDHLSGKLGLAVVSITDRQYRQKDKEELLKDHGILPDPSVQELIYHLKNAKYILTDSYHGTCFSLVFRKPFAAMINRTRGVSRFDTLCELFGIEDRCVYEPSDIIHDGSFLARPDYAAISPLIKRETERSRVWLSDKLLGGGRSEKSPGTAKARQKIINELHILTGMGYSIGKYLADAGIAEVSVYCPEKYMDMFESFFISLTFDGCVRVNGYYSGRSFRFEHAQKQIFGAVEFRKGLPDGGVLLYISDIPEELNAPGCTVLSMLKLEWEALSYAMNFRPLMFFKKAHPDVRILVFNAPVFPKEGCMDGRERLIYESGLTLSGDNITDPLPEALAAFAELHTADEWRSLFSLPETCEGADGKPRLSDRSGSLMNIRNGHRVTAEQPAESGRTIFMLGGDMVFGYGCADDETAASYLQQALNRKYDGIRVENYGRLTSLCGGDIFGALFELPVSPGDIIVFETWAALPELCSGYADSLDLSGLFQRPHKFGDVMADRYHLSCLGQKALAGKIFERLESRGFCKKDASAPPALDLAARPLWGTPEAPAPGNVSGGNV